MGFIYYAEKAQVDKTAHEEYAKNLASELSKQKKI